MNAGVGNIIIGAIGMLLVGAFLIGLAISIESLPFAVIVAGVLCLAVAEYYEDGVRPFLRSLGGGRPGTGG
jgi:hypothetical protein